MISKSEYENVRFISAQYMFKEVKFWVIVFRCSNWDCWKFQDEYISQLIRVKLLFLVHLILYFIIIFSKCNKL